MKVLLASSERFAGCMIDSLIRAGHEVVGVVSPARGIYQRGYEGLRFWFYDLRGWDIQKACLRNNIEMRVSRYLEDGSIHSLIKTKTPDVLLLYGWPTLVKAETRALLPLGVINIHPSLLPKLRGADPLFDVVDKDLDAFGITFHTVVDELDAGPIHLQVPLSKGPRDTYDDLYFKVLDALHKLLPRALATIQKNSEGKPQQGEPTQVSRWKERFAVLDPTMPLEELDRRVRACWSHHRMITSSQSFLVYFSRLTVIGDAPPDVAETTITRVGPMTFDAVLHGRVIRFGGLSFPKKSRFTTPLYLRLDLQKGRRLDSAETTLSLLKARGLN